MIQVAFDESGNTGQNLLDPDSKLFALASCSFTTQQASDLSAIFAGVQASELKYSKMAGRPRNQQLILHFLRSHQVNSETVKIS